jgi:hypothetical protein
MIEALPDLERDLLAWVNQADSHLALVVEGEVAGFGARTRHTAHPQRDLAAVYVAPHVGDQRHYADALYHAVPLKKPLKVRLPGYDAEGLAVAADHGLTERIRSATYRVGANAYAGTPSLPVEAIANPTRELNDAFNLLYADAHRWDPPSIFTRRYVRQAMLNGAQQMAVVRDHRGEIIGVGAAHYTDDPSAAADISLVGPLDQSHPDAREITASLLAHLATVLRGRARAALVRDRHGRGHQRGAG